MIIVTEMGSVYKCFLTAKFLDGCELIEAPYLDLDCTRSHAESIGSGSIRVRGMINVVA